MSLIEEMVKRNNELTQRNIDAINHNTKVIQQLLGMPPPSQIRHDMSFSSRDINVTSSHTDYEINVVRPCHFIQVWCDGVTDGISIKLNSTSNPSYSLNKFIILPVNNPEKIYFTNDVRAGRSSLTIYFVHASVPLTMYLGGEPAEVSRAELAARLGSINTFDRRGEVIWWDDFEDNINKWTISGTVTLTIEKCLFGSQSAKMVTGNIIDNIVHMRRFLSYPYLSKFGTQISFTVPPNNHQFEFRFYVYDGTSMISFIVRYDSLSQKLFYIDSAGAYTEFASGVSLLSSTDVFHTQKLVIDGAKNKYIRFILNNTEYDLSNFDPRLTASAGAPYIIIQHLLRTKVASSLTSYIDCAIITQNEP